MSGRVILAPKGSSETRTVEFDFSDELEPTEDILTQIVEASVYSGVDASPSDIVDGSASHSGNVVSQSIKDGLVGVTYILTCAIGTTANQILIKIAYLVIEDS